MKTFSKFVPSRTADKPGLWAELCVRDHDRLFFFCSFLSAAAAGTTVTVFALQRNAQLFFFQTLADSPRCRNPPLGARCSRSRETWTAKSLWRDNFRFAGV